MIAILKKDGRYCPVIVCDQCGMVIDDALAAMEVSSSAPEGTTAQAFHVHKGTCDQALSARLGGIHGSEELVVHLVELVKNALRLSDTRQVQNLLAWSDDTA
jgi:transcription initiation factor TFIIIB Brf1 subunit/transcription initiation factor TFIIB